MTHKVLVIEDNRDISRLLALHLRDAACEVSVARDGPEGLAAARREPFDLIILDVMLPGMDGLELCRRLRGERNFTPILMLTAKTSEIDRVVGLEIGADDYVTKPFSIREILARVKAMFRRAEQFSDASPPAPDTAPAEVIRAGDIVIDVDKRRVTVDDRVADLTAKEFELLLRFARHPGRVYTRQQLLDSVWGYAHDGYEHTVNSHINRLRNKIERNAAKPRYIRTVWGVGYKFQELTPAD